MKLVAKTYAALQQKPPCDCFGKLQIALQETVAEFVGKRLQTALEVQCKPETFAFKVTVVPYHCTKHISKSIAINLAYSMQAMGKCGNLPAISRQLVREYMLP